MDMNDSTTKRCSKCGAEFPATIEYFKKSNRNKSGIASVCKGCHRNSNLLYMQSRRQDPEYRKAESKKIATRSKTRYSQDTEYRETVKARVKKLQSNEGYRESKSEYDKTRYAEIVADSERANDLKQQQRLRLSNPQVREQKNKRSKILRQLPHYKEIRRLEGSRRRARKHFLPNDMTVQQWEKCLSYWGCKCCVCGRPRGLWHTLAMDHWIPLTDNALDNPGTTVCNIVPLCHGIDGCNNSKNNREAGEWLANRFGKRKAKQILKRINDYFEWIRTQQE